MRSLSLVRDFINYMATFIKYVTNETAIWSLWLRLGSKNSGLEFEKHRLPCNQAIVLISLFRLLLTLVIAFSQSEVWACGGTWGSLGLHLSTAINKLGQKQMVISQTCYNINVGLDGPPLQFQHGLIIIHHWFLQIELHIDALIGSLKSVNTLGSRWHDKVSESSNQGLLVGVPSCFYRLT